MLPACWRSSSQNLGRWSVPIFSDVDFMWKFPKRYGGVILGMIPVDIGRLIGYDSNAPSFLEKLISESWQMISANFFRMLTPCGSFPSDMGWFGVWFQLILEWFFKQKLVICLLCYDSNWYWGGFGKIFGTVANKKHFEHSDKHQILTLLLIWKTLLMWNSKPNSHF